jgi:hypothetical protein
VAITYRLGTHWFSHRTAIAATLLVAFAPFQVHYAQEIRMYGLTALFLGLAFYCLQMARQTSRTAWWLGFAVLSAFAQYTHNLSVFFLIIFIVPVLYRRILKPLFTCSVRVWLRWPFTYPGWFGSPPNSQIFRVVIGSRPRVQKDCLLYCFSTCLTCQFKANGCFQFCYSQHLFSPSAFTRLLL